MQTTSLAGRTILIVEDDPFIAMDITLALRSAGVVVLAAAALAHARELVNSDGLSAAVLDFGLRDGDANGLCARLNERGIPYVLHSGYAYFGHHCHRGVVVSKPTNPTVLIDALIQLLGGDNGGSPPTLRPQGDL